jgi:FlaA1/EpsC-like NDP-sugar epimerase
MIRIFEHIGPHIVFHAAALKHVPVLEANPEEAVLTNVIGTRNVIEAGSRVGMERFILISTDKAVDPTSVMGATKRVAEIMTQVGSERDDGCVYTAVRFGNVLGSRGSVIPTFVEQIKSGGPVTVTDAGMTRYFMTVDEAVQLVLQASALATGSELFLLDMGEPVKIDDLARRLIRLAGLTPDEDIEIRYVGRRPGEKLNEVLSNHPLEHTAHDKIYDVRLDHPQAGTLMEIVTEMESSALRGETALVLAKLNELADGQLASLVTMLDLTEDPSAIAWS